MTEGIPIAPRTAPQPPGAAILMPGWARCAAMVPALGRWPREPRNLGATGTGGSGTSCAPGPRSGDSALLGETLHGFLNMSLHCRVLQHLSRAQQCNKKILLRGIFRLSRKSRANWQYLGTFGESPRDQWNFLGSDIISHIFFNYVYCAPFRSRHDLNKLFKHSQYVEP